jgi:signal transduction histidine kinase/PleD family two-component response regulator
VWSETQVDHAYELRYKSYRLADELRHSSDDLTLMARAYVITGDSHYKDNYQSILDIRNGKKPRLEGYHNYYSDKAINEQPSAQPSDRIKGIPLLALIRQLGTSDEEFHKLDEAKSNSDALAVIEIKAMALVEDQSADADKMRAQAIRMLHDNQYIKAKAAIMQPIDEFFTLMDQRTLTNVQTATRYADYVRIVFVMLALILVGVLYQVNRRMQTSLNETTDATEKYKVTNQALIQKSQVIDSTLRKLKLATEVSGIGIWIWEFAQDKLHWDDRMFDIYGVPKDRRNIEISYDFWSTRVHPDDLPDTEVALNVSRDHNQYLRNTFRILLPDGKIRFIDSGSVIEHDASGKPLRMIGINRDITDFIEQQETLNIAMEKAKAANVAKSSFLANMSHEIRTPMNGVLGMLDLLSETELTPTQFDWIKTAHGSGQALIEIINDILDLTKLEADKFEIEWIDFNLVDLIEDICTLLANRAHGKGIELNCLLPINLAPCWQGDPLRIRQVLTNLMGNAIKFTEQGEVFLNIIQMPAVKGQSELRFEIHDTGIGISDETLSGLFERFSQADEATSRRFGGTGLGLSISKKLVELMGGTIGVNSVPGKGSCFWFTLVLNQSESSKALLTTYDLSGKRTLIVDDNATNRNILNTYLKNWGLIVNEVDNGGEALMKLQTSILQGVTYDLILLDMQMPVMDGLTLAKCLSQIPALAHIPIILLSSDNGVEPASYQGTGIVQRLLKPLRQMQLYDAMVTALQGVAIPSDLKPELPKTQQPSYSGKKVLVVEDNKINQKVIVSKLSKFDIVPDVVENGQLALDILAHNTYDLIFMDCHMPVMDGYTASRELRLLEAKQRLPAQTIVALTANAMKGEFEKCQEAGMDDYLSKPIKSEQLMTLLAARLG